MQLILVVCKMDMINQISQRFTASLNCSDVGQLNAVQQVIVNNMAAEGEIGWLTDICVLLVQR